RRAHARVVPARPQGAHAHDLARDALVRVSIVRPHEARDPADVCVVIDVVRATTTATVLCHRLGGLCAVRGPDEVALLPPRDDGYVVFSELSTIQPDVMRYDNSPVLAKNAELGRRMPVLVTTN